MLSSLSRRTTMLLGRQSNKIVPSAAVSRTTRASSQPLQQQRPFVAAAYAQQNLQHTPAAAALQFHQQYRFHQISTGGWQRLQPKNGNNNLEPWFVEHPSTPQILGWIDPEAGTDDESQLSLQQQQQESYEMTNRNARRGKRANKGKRPCSRHRRRRNKRSIGRHRR